jgi:hypothetical protein
MSVVDAYGGCLWRLSWAIAYGGLRMEVVGECPALSDGGLLDVRWCGDRSLGMEAAGADAGVVG